MCLVESATTHTILRDNFFFCKINFRKANVNTISGTANLIKGFRRANIMLPSETKLYISNALYSSKSKRNLLSFKDIRCNRYPIETINKSNVEYLRITSVIQCQEHILEKRPALSSGLYHTTIRTVESHVVMNQKFSDPKNFMFWHDRLGHPRAIMMRILIENSYEHTLNNQKVFFTRGLFMYCLFSRQID